MFRSVFALWLTSTLVLGGVQASVIAADVLQKVDAAADATASVEADSDIESSASVDSSAEAEADASIDAGSSVRPCVHLSGPHLGRCRVAAAADARADLRAALRTGLTVR